MRHVDPAPIQELLDKIAGVSDTATAFGCTSLSACAKKLLTDPKAIRSICCRLPASRGPAPAPAGPQCAEGTRATEAPKNFRLFQLLKELHSRPPIPGVTLKAEDEQ